MQQFSLYRYTHQTSSKEPEQNSGDRHTRAETLKKRLKSEPFAKELMGHLISGQLLKI